MVERHVRKVEFHISKVGILSITECHGGVTQGVMWVSLVSQWEPHGVAGYHVCGTGHHGGVMRV